MENESYSGFQPCAYCGEVAYHRDHVVPVSFARSNRRTERKDPRITVPACEECNQLLSNRMFWTWEERTTFVKDRLRARYEDYLLSPQLTDEEIAQFEGSLRVYIEQRQLARSVIKQRLAYVFPEGQEILERALDRMNVKTISK